jgi:TonB family protein
MQRTSHVRYPYARPMFRDPFLACLITAAVCAVDRPCSAQAPAPDEPVFAIAEKMPEFPGGQPALRSYLMSHFEYPEEAMDATVDGPVQVSFVVTKEGAIRDAHVVRGQHFALDAEALRLVKGMPAWIPGQQHGKPVNVLYTMPIRFATPPSATPPKRTVQAPGQKN